MSDQPNPKRGRSARIANPVAGWVAIFFQPAIIVFVAVASGGLTDWKPIISKDWSFVAFSTFCMGYILFGYLLASLAQRGNSSSSGAAGGATQDAPTKIE